MALIPASVRARGALAGLILAAIACGDDDPTAPDPVLTTITVTVSASSIQQGQAATATAAGLDQHGDAIALGTVSWSSSASGTATVDAAGAIVGAGPGTANIIATVGGKTGQAPITVSAPAGLKVNEVESNGGTPGDWIEIFNPTGAAVSLAGWVLKDNDDTHVYTFPAGSTIAAGAHLVVEESALGYGLGGEDAARLHSAFGVLVDSYTWTAHAVTTYGRCPDGTGEFTTTTVVTKGAANDCSVAVTINEIESNGGTPGDWVELYNSAGAPANIGGWQIKDNDDTHVYTLPANTVVPAQGYLVIEEASLNYGLGAPDAVRVFNAAGTLVDSHTWTAHASTTTYGRCPDGSGAFQTTTTVTKGAANDCAAAVRVNEVESNGGTPGDWIELINASAGPVDLGGWIVRDNDDSHDYVIPAGTVVPAGGFYVVEEAAMGFGLGAADDARLFNPGNGLVDSYTWTAHATTTYGRCPDGSGAFATTTAPTKGAPNACPGGAMPWPGSDDVTTVDVAATFGGNMSGLTYEPAAGGAPAVLWASKNGPGTVYRLLFDGTNWLPDATGGWGAGKALRYPGGTGDPDAEGITFTTDAAAGLYVATERNNAASGVSRNAILRFNPADAGATLTATNEWNLTALLPVVGANLGAEAITWIPDDYLVAQGFFDESKGAVYNPAQYANHGTGLFFVGLEANGVIYAFALDHVANTASLIATIATAFPGVMALEFDRELGYLWAICDDGCGGQSATLEISQTAGPTSGRYQVTRTFNRAPSMPNLNNEGFAIAPLAECAGGNRPVFWSDDTETGGHALRRAGLPCVAFGFELAGRRAATVQWKR